MRLQKDQKIAHVVCMFMPPLPSFPQYSMSHPIFEATYLGSE